MDLKKKQTRPPEIIRRREGRFEGEERGEEEGEGEEEGIGC